MNKEIEAVKKIQAGYKPSLSFSKPLEGAKLRVLSLGAGVQSSVLALMAAKGEIGPKLDCAIFADTQYEPKAVYEHLQWLVETVSNPLRVKFPFPVYQVTAGNIKEDSMAGLNIFGTKFSSMPLFTTGKMGMRQCTNDYKIQPVKKETRKQLGLAHRQRAPKEPVVEQWLGISTDEMPRMKISREKYVQNRWPLIEENMNRRDCLAWFDKNYPGRPLPKSACITCPFRTNAEWRDMRNNSPDDWAEAVEFDYAIRDVSDGEKQYSHKSCVPLDEVDLSTAADKGQAEFGFLEECEGMCGV